MNSDKVVRCGIYTRKSHEDGLELEFNSLDAQRESAENYIASQKENGWIALPEKYDDGGFSGGNMERPALKQLMADVKAGNIDCIVVYKIDRLSRSLLDFTQLIETLNKYNVNFVSVTQHIQTTDSAGRMMLNILMTFSQYEREIIAERIKDKIAMSKRRGKYCGGYQIIGYDVDHEKKKLVINEKESEIVKYIFARYPELGSAKKLAAELNEKGYRTKTWTSRKDRHHEGQPWNTGHIFRVLNSPVYLGKVTHYEKTFPGEHDAIISQKAWDKVHQIFEDSCHGQKRKSKIEMNTPLRGIIRCGHCGGAMAPTYSRNGKRRYTYYFCQKDSKRAVSTCPLKRIPGGDVEKAVIQQLGAVFRTPSLMAHTFAKASELESSERERLVIEKQSCESEIFNIQSEITKLMGTNLPEKDDKIESVKNLVTRLNGIKEELLRFKTDPINEQDVVGAFGNIEELWELLFPAEQYRLMRLIIESINVMEDSISIILKTDEMPSLIAELSGIDISDRKEKTMAGKESGTVFPEILPEGKVMLRVPAFFKYKNGRKMIITPETLEGKNLESPSKVQSPIVNALRNAHEWKSMLESGKAASTAALARDLNLSRPYVTRILSLTTLSPDIVTALINGEEPNGLSLDKLVSGFPADWEEQKRIFNIKSV